jgi:uncharacterized protein YceH (UPF0502 family)
VESVLDAVAVRVIGALIEKEITTPDAYPLTLNALVAACNQTSNRDPIMALDDATVARSIEDLRRRSLVRAVQKSDSRTMRYRQLFTDLREFDGAETATMTVLMLRGAQTTGEIKTRTNRLFEFTDLAQVDATLEALMIRNPPLVARLPRRPGQKEVRYAHLLSGEPVDVQDFAAPVTESPKASRVDALEQSVEGLRTELAELRAAFEEFKRQF